MDYNFVKKAFDDWCFEHGSKFDSDEVSVMSLDEPEHYDADNRPAFRVEVAFEVAQASMRESGAIVQCALTHMREYGPQMPAYIMLDAQLVDFNFRQHEMPQVIFTVAFDYRIQD